MAARQATQSNAMLYAMVVFIGLFIVATVFAVIFYVKSEEYRTQAELAKEDLSKVVKPGERTALERIVGKTEADMSYLGTLQKVINDLYSMISGQEASGEVPATVKFNDLSMKIDQTRKLLGADYNPAFGPNGIALLKTIEELKQKLENERAQIANLQEINEDLQVDLEDKTAQLDTALQNYKTELNEFMAEVDRIRDRFDSLRETLSDANQEQVQDVEDKLEQAQAQLRTKQLELQTTADQLTDTTGELQDALDKLDAIKPKPDREVQAYVPDAQIVRVDLQNGIVYLDAGINDHVYRGLTFAIYDRNMPIPEDGTSKAEIEVFQVEEQVCAARFIKSDKKNPVVKGDIVTNLIWDRDTTNRFVVIGAFDYNNDGRIDADGAQRIGELIERWGGTVSDDISVDTDFVVVGSEPSMPPRPTEDEIDIDPMAQQRYETARANAAAYNDMLKKANSLGVPVFNQKRFMLLIGYDTLLEKNPTL